MQITADPVEPFTEIISDVFRAPQLERGSHRARMGRKRVRKKTFFGLHTHCTVEIGPTRKSEPRC